MKLLLIFYFIAFSVSISQSNDLLKEKFKQDEQKYFTPNQKGDLDDFDFDSFKEKTIGELLEKIPYKYLNKVMPRYEPLGRIIGYYFNFSNGMEIAIYTKSKPVEKYGYLHYEDVKKIHHEKILGIKVSNYIYKYTKKAEKALRETQKWIKKMFGFEYTIKELKLLRDLAGDKIIYAEQRKKYVKKMSKITDKDLIHFKPLYNLRDIYFWDASKNITDKGLAHLKDLLNLKGLELGNSKITDKGLVYLKGFRRLRGLNLSNTGITDKGLKHISSLKYIEGLVLNNTQITDKGLMHLKSFKYLEDLYLENTQITDRGLIHLKSIKSLRQLYLSNTQITDKGLVHLKSLKKLYRLIIENTKITKKGIKYLRLMFGDDLYIND